MLGNAATGCKFIPADRSCSLHLDIEIKTADLATASHGTRWTNIVKEHSKLLKDMRSDFAGVECAAGYTLLQAHVETHSRYWLDRCLRQSSQEVLNACWTVNVSLSFGGSMKLLVYEIAESFAVENWRYIMGEVVAGTPLTSPEDRFRIRSLMLYTKQMR
jgi:hypothetical protein